MKTCATCGKQIWGQPLPLIGQKGTYFCSLRCRDSYSQQWQQSQEPQTL